MIYAWKSGIGIFFRKVGSGVDRLLGRLWIKKTIGMNMNRGITNCMEWRIQPSKLNNNNNNIRRN